MAMRFRVNGVPAPQGSKRHVGGGRMVESSRAVGPWREAVRAEAQRCRWEHRTAGVPGVVPGPILPSAHGPVSVTLVFVLARPQGHYGTGSRACTVRPSAPKYPGKRPDLDKLTRAVLDGLVMGGVMADDSQVVSLSAAKVWASDGQAPGAIIEVEAMT